mmetsp:Transcript_9409/g.32742  ORF Transcript_9409/g.32742 Transcript_9409/m.32742 type:complete len:893 (+) Transcript_9409:207-2885(+)
MEAPAECILAGTRYEDYAANKTLYADRGFVVQYFDSSEQKECADSWLLLPGANVWSIHTQRFVYFAGLVYVFLGVSIISDIFMAAVEQITSKEKSVTLSDGRIVTIKFWNATVANLTLLALGSSAPEILLSVIETGLNLGKKPGELGASTIVGSAAFNLLMITAICMVSLPPGESRRISDVGVFWMTSAWSIWAYIWMLVVLVWNSEGVVTMGEAWATLIFFPTFVGMSYAQDQSWWRKARGLDQAAEGEGDDEENGVTSPQHVKIVSAGITGGAEEETDIASKKEVMYTMKELKVDKVPKKKLKNMALSVVAALSKSLKGMGSRKVPSSATYKMNARRAFAGGKYKSTLKEKSDAVEMNMLEDGVEKNMQEVDSSVGFTTDLVSVMEDCGTAKLIVERSGNMNLEVEVDYETQEGTALAGSDYQTCSGTLVFKPDESRKLIEVAIIDDDVPEPDKTFNVVLKGARVAGIGSGGACAAKLKEPSLLSVLIIDDDDPGEVSFESRTYAVLESAGQLEIDVVRHGGSAGEVSVEYYSSDASAKSGVDYQACEGTLTFASGELRKTITVTVMDDESPNPDTIFRMHLQNVKGGVKLGHQNVAVVKIEDDDVLGELTDEVNNLLSKQGKHSSAFFSRDGSWARQFQEAFEVGGETDDDGNVTSTFMDYVMHFATILWKVLFATCPPTDYWGGFGTFIVSLLWIGVITAIVAELAALFGCSFGLKDSVTAITFVALGTSLPDTFASRQATLEADDADAAIGNVTGSNSVNVFLGLGLPWVIAACYYAVNDKDTDGAYCVPPTNLAYSVVLFTVAAVMCLVMLGVRRAVLGCELGGPPGPARACSVFLATLWFLYVLLSALNAYGYNLEINSMEKSYNYDAFGCKCGSSVSSGKGCPT